MAYGFIKYGFYIGLFILLIVAICNINNIKLYSKKTTIEIIKYALKKSDYIKIESKIKSFIETA